jgi:hypothetical protein
MGWQPAVDALRRVVQLRLSAVASGAGTDGPRYPA